jgi:hypothetical protein
MVQTDRMGFVVTVLVMFPKSPTDHVITALDHQFGAVDHPHGSKVVTITEHVSVANEADAVAFVRSLVEDALPQGAKVTEVSAVAG